MGHQWLIVVFQSRKDKGQFLMGFLSEKLGHKSTASFQGSEDSRKKWDQVFARSDKETTSRAVSISKPTPGGDWARSATEGASIVRLIQALRSKAPGGWSDDRWAQSKKWMGVWYIAGHRLCTLFQQSKFTIYQKDPNHPDGKRIARGPGVDEAIQLLEKPNKQDSFGKWFYRLKQQKLLTGTALNWKVPDGLGTPREMYIMPTSTMIPQPVINPQYPDGFYRVQPLYPYGPFSSYPTPSTSVGAPVPGQWVDRFMYPHPMLFYDGWSPLTALQKEMDEFEMIGRSRWYKMNKSINPAAVLQSENAEGAIALPEAEINRIVAIIEAAFMGPENAGQLFVSAPGYRLEEFGSRPIDMDYQSGWEQLLGYLMAGIGITKVAAGMVEDSSYATLFATLKQLYFLEIEPECDDVADTLTRNLLPYFGDDLILEIKPKRIDDHEITFAKIGIAMQAIAIKKNEVRKMLDMPLTAEPWGEDMAGDPSPKMEEQQQQMAMGGMGGGGEEQGGEDPFGNSGSPDETKQEPTAVSQSRPSTGSLGQGSAGGPGARKSLDKIKGLEKTLQILQKRGVVNEKEIKQLKIRYNRRPLSSNGVH